MSRSCSGWHGGYKQSSTDNLVCSDSVGRFHRKTLGRENAKHNKNQHHYHLRSEERRF